MKRKWIYILLILALAGYGLTGVVQVRPGEQAVIRRFGRVLADKPGPGLHIGLPWGMDQVDCVVVDQVRSVTVGFEDEEASDGGMPPGQLLTGDNNLVNVQTVLYYRVQPDELEEYVVNRDRLDDVLTRAAESAMGEWVANHAVDEVLLRGKPELRAFLLKALPARFHEYRLGIELRDARVALIAPPEEVKDAFDAVSRAQTQMLTLQHKAEQDAETRLRVARSESYGIEQNAEAFKTSKTLLARQEAGSFEKRLVQYQRGRKTNPLYLLQIWENERGNLFKRLKSSGRLDLLDHHLGPDGLDLMTAPLAVPKR
jgi:membrane protease subunit HflK